MSSVIGRRVVYHSVPRAFRLAPTGDCEARLTHDVDDNTWYFKTPAPQVPTFPTAFCSRALRVGRSSDGDEWIYFGTAAREMR